MRVKLRLYWSLVKGLQTGLLLATGLAGYISARCPVLSWPTLIGLMGSLFLAIGGSTIINMWYDRDIDAKMDRACRRPLPSGKIKANEALVVGLVIAFIGVLWAVALDPLFGTIVLAGLFFDVVIYTIWLKRRTAWSIVFGGVAGGMPVLAGRALGLGAVDWIGIVLAMAVLFWIPTHILTYSMRYFDDYQRAGLPTFPSTYGFRTTRKVISLSSILAGVCMVVATVGIGMESGYLRLLGVLSAGLLLMALGTLVRPSDRLNFGLFKYASFYMLGAMLVVVLGVL
ncbi:MAG TPA: heme o synthase [candidate division Zixibacteria bacterium]|nr:heme o synthase [candidate division Zixibacteria bacterium]